MTVVAADRADQLLAELGFESWRPGQKEAVEAGLEGRDSLIVMPTGGGKSLCYQLPGLATEDLTIVVSPLIALMNDQWQRLIAAGHPVAMISSGMSPEAARGRPRPGAQRRGADRLLLAGALCLQCLPRCAGAAADRPDGGRRGALRLGVGARLPARLPAPAGNRRAARSAGGDGLHGDGDQGGRGRDRLPLRPAQTAAGALRLRPSQPLLRRRPARGQRVEGAAAGAARSGPGRPREPAGDRLLRHPARHRRGGAVPARLRPARARLPRRHGGRGAHHDPAPLHDRRGGSDRRHQRLRHGRRQGQRALGLAHGDPDQPRGLLPGGRPRRARRAAGEGGAAGDEGRPRPPGPLHRTARSRTGDRPRARLARLPHDQVLHLRGSLPAPQHPRPLRRSRGGSAAGPLLRRLRRAQSWLPDPETITVRAPSRAKATAAPPPELSDADARSSTS